ncbi:LAGLIDADG family homing endonuclease [Candidatus Micrarchaeota archaeon]|nr:LAGLIDADG family homing endonuclease [Candidatus Micrarchaeota archaeon]
MKIKLTPELSYVVGLWRKARCSDGLGVQGGKEVLEVFSQDVLEKQLTTSDKLLCDENKVYFYHTAYRKFFQEVEKEELERFKYLNEYAANYLAGTFDAAGHIDERGVVSIGQATKQDEMMLLRLGFQTRRRADRLVIERPVVFLTFIRNYVRIFKGHKVFDYIKAHEKAAK